MPINLDHQRFLKRQTKCVFLNLLWTRLSSLFIPSLHMQNVSQHCSSVCLHIGYLLNILFKFACLSPYGNFLLTCFPIPVSLSSLSPIKNHLTCYNKFKRKLKMRSWSMKNWKKGHPYCFSYHSHRDSDIIDGMVMLISLETNFYFGICSKKNFIHIKLENAGWIPKRLRGSMGIWFSSWITTVDSFFLFKACPFYEENKRHLGLFSWDFN